ncbi:Von Willebrand factor A [Mactra antiquata]
MPIRAARKYNLVCYHGDTSVSVRPEIKKERKVKENGSVKSDSDAMSGMEYNVCEVVKSPKAPQYEIHYAKTRKNGLQLVRKKTKIGRKLLDKVKKTEAYISNTDDDETVTSETTVQSREDMGGLRVIACNRHDGLYYSGTVNKTPDSTFAIVTFNNKKQQKVRTQMIIPMSGAIARPELATGDFVLVRVYNQTTCLECYVPGIVEVLPENFRQHNKFYSILLYNGQRETTLRRMIVKIGKARFEMAIRYISHIQQQRVLRSSSRSSSSSSTVRSYEEKQKKEKPQKSKKERSRSSSEESRSISRGSGSRSSSSSSTVRSRSYEKKQKKGKPTKSKKERSRSSSEESRSRSRGSSSRSSSSSSTVRSRSYEKKQKKGKPQKSKKERSRSSSEESRSRSRGTARSDGSSTPRNRSPFERPNNPEPRTESEKSMRKDIYYERNRQSIYQSESRMTDASQIIYVDEKDEMIQTLQHQLGKQKRKQLRQERRLVRQARKINKIQRKMRDSDTSHNDSANSSQAEKFDREKNVQSSYSETEVTSPHQRKGSPDGTSYHEQVDFQNLVRSRPDSILEQEVLARWTDDGWYYSGYVIGDRGDDQYIVRDSTGYKESIHRGDILTSAEHNYNTIQPEDFVIGLHPKYMFSYAPAEVLSTHSNYCVKVEFFDGNLAELNSEEIYKISKSKYHEVVDYIKKCEKRMIGKSVVARDDNTGLYKLGVIDSRVGLGQQFYIKWLDGDMCKQNSHHIFEVAKPPTSHDKWCYILAPISDNNATYMPAVIMQHNPPIIQLCDGPRTSDVALDQCFWISEEYYTNAAALLQDITNRNNSLNIS